LGGISFNYLFFLFYPSIARLQNQNISSKTKIFERSPHFGPYYIRRHVLYGRVESNGAVCGSLAKTARPFSPIWPVIADWGAKIPKILYRQTGVPPRKWKGCCMEYRAAAF
jgi:hypothetical protein